MASFVVRVGRPGLFPCPLAGGHCDVMVGMSVAFLSSTNISVGSEGNLPQDSIC